MIHQSQHRSLMCSVATILILAILLPTTATWASGISVTYGGFAGSCGPTGIHIPTVTGNSTGAATFDGTVRVDSQVVAMYVDSFPAGVFATHFNTPSIPAHSLPYTATWTIAVRGGQTTVITVVCNANGSITASSSIVGGSPSSGQFFNPGDNRVDGRPGDRVAVWCNSSATPPNVVVYGVSETSNGGGGFLLGQFTYIDLLTAGTQGITKSVGTGNGTVSAMTDGQGHFYTAWNGGQFGADGQGNFSKSFTCSFPSTGLTLTTSCSLNPYIYEFYKDPSNMLDLALPDAPSKLLETVSNALSAVGLGVDILKTLTEPPPDEVNVNLWADASSSKYFVQVVRKSNGKVLSSQFFPVNLTKTSICGVMGA